MAISEKKMRIVINNYFKTECDVNTSIHQAFEKGFRIGVKKGLSAQQERPKGNWVEIGDEPYDEWECDMCGFVIDGSGCIDPEEYKDVYKFCPNCGADMR